MMKQDMFASNNNTEINQIVLDHHNHHVIVNNSNPSSMEEQQQHQENSYDLHDFPDPFLDHDDLFFSHFLSQQQQQHDLFNNAGNCWQEQEQEEEQKHHETTKENLEKGKKMKKAKKCRKIGSSSSTKRTGKKKDRHSKICTAQGPRDRRMRLSLQIARKFFNLQDMLGFDKASKTIEWLLSNSNSAIKDLKNTTTTSTLNNNNNNNNNSGFSYGSVCSAGSSEVLSDQLIIRDHNAKLHDDEEATAFMATLKDKKNRQLRTVARDSRDRARARARQRTLFKKTQQQQQHQEHQNSSNFNFQDPNSELQDDTHFQDCSTITRIHHKVLDLAISDHHHLSDFPPIQSFFSGNNNNNTILQNLDFSTLSCPNSIFMASPIPKPYSSFSDSTLLKLP